MSKLGKVIDYLKIDITSRLEQPTLIGKLLKKRKEKKEKDGKVSKMQK